MRSSGRLARQGLLHRFAFEVGWQFYRLHALVNERLQLGRESRRIPDFNGIRERRTSSTVTRGRRSAMNSMAVGMVISPSRFETGSTLVALVAFVNLVA